MTFDFREAVLVPMVHIKRVELTNFKSFGGTTQIPLLPGFTVVSGPNGSGKSNILDALLFCLGIASSRGMRAERLPDLVNHNKERRGTVEASVSVTFDLSDYNDNENLKKSNRAAEHVETRHVASENTAAGGSLAEQFAQEQIILAQNPPSGEQENPKSPEWSVTRRLRVTKQGNYTSTYYINGEVCTQTELHEQLNNLRVYPEGYNVVLQGDVTGIITMKPRERREIIDELAGVAAFDRKIEQTKETLTQVKEREERCRILEQELTLQRDRLAADRLKAEKYQKLRAEIEQKQQWEVVLKWRLLQQQETKLKGQIATGEAQTTQLREQLGNLTVQIEQATTQLDQLNTQVKALGEEEQVAVASTLASQQAQQQQLQNRQQELEQNQQQAEANLKRTQEEIQQQEQTLKQLKEEKDLVETQDLSSACTVRDKAQTALEQSRQEASAIASASEAWVQQQTALTKQIETLLQGINPQRTEQAQLQERHTQLSRLTEEQTQLLEKLEPEITGKQAQAAELETQLAASSLHIQNLVQSLAAAEQELQIQQQTQKRLLSEQREKQRQLDKLEAQAQAQQESLGTYATKVILEAGIPGICGLVAAVVLVGWQGLRRQPPALLLPKL